MAECGTPGYSGSPYSIIAYEGSELCAPTGAEPPSPSSNVRDFKEDNDRLGCGEYDVFVTQRCSQGISCVLDSVSSLNFDRRLDDVSQAEVIIDLGGDSTATCCQCLADVEPWCHELHIWRDGEEVWVGPIISIEYTYRRIEIKAKDSLGWLEVRVLPIDVDFVGTPTEIVDVADFVVTAAFAEDTTTCEIDNIFLADSGILLELFFEAFQQTALETLTDLGEIGVDYTTVGRTIVLVGDETPLNPLVILNDEHIIGDVKITKDGELQGNRYYVHFDGDLGVPASGEAADFFCYGPIERLRDGDGLVDGVSAGQVADIYVDGTAIAPRIMEVPAGSKLSPATPWTFDKMVPGARVDVAVTRTCFELTSSFRLMGVQVEVTDDDEQVGITLSPVNAPTP